MQYLLSSIKQNSIKQDILLILWNYCENSFDLVDPLKGFPTTSYSHPGTHFENCWFSWVEEASCLYALTAGLVFAGGLTNFCGFSGMFESCWSFANLLYYSWKRTSCWSEINAHGRLAEYSPPSQMESMTPSRPGLLFLIDCCVAFPLPLTWSILPAMSHPLLTDCLLPRQSLQML